MENHSTPTQTSTTLNSTNEANKDISSSIVPTIETSSSATELLCCITSSNFEEIFEKIQNNYYINEWNKLFIEHFISTEKDKKYDFDLLQRIIEFFLNENEEEEKTAYTSEKEIYFVNYMISSFKNLDYQKMIDVFTRYLKRENKDKQDFLFYVNSSLMFVDMSIKLNLNNIAKYLLNKLNENIKTYYGEKHQELIYPNNLVYLNHINLFTPNLNQKHYDNLFMLYLCFININQNNNETAKQLLCDIKKSISDNAPSNYSNILKNFYKILKIRIDYVNNTQFKFYKHLNSLLEFSSTANVDSLQSILFYYNSLGIQNLKQKNYSMAEYCFKHCETLIHQNEMASYKYLSIVLYNISLCFFYSKKYEKCYKILSSLKNIDYFSNNPYLFYRLGLCCLERELQEAKQNAQTENVNDVVNKIINDETKRIVLVNSSPQKENIDEDSNKNIIEAISSFKQCLLIMNGYTFYEKDIHNLFEKYDTKSIQNITCNSKQYNNIYPSVYLNLIFCLLRNEDYNEAISTAKEFELYTKENSLTKNYQFIIDNYMIEAYLRTHSVLKALEVLEKNNFTMGEIKGTFYTENNKLIYNEVAFKLTLYVNLVKVNLMREKDEEAKKLIGVILSFYKESKDVPSFVINVIIYYLVYTGETELAIKTLKYRKIPKGIFEKV